MSLYSETYIEARSQLLDAASARGARMESFWNPCGLGPAGEQLRTDVACIGPMAPARLLVCVSGTHGIEGFAGSAIQTGLLRAGFPASAPADLGFLVIHALNPYGFAYRRRVNEDNVDVNRNFIDHERPPGNPGYPQLHRALAPSTWDRASRRWAAGFLQEYARQHDPRALQATVTQGQWTHPDGLFYGGTAPVWSHRTLSSIASRYLAGVPRIGYIDLHTGLGKRAWGEPIFRGGPDPGALKRARAWYSEHLTGSADGSSSSTPIVGNTASLVASMLGDGQLMTAITLEFGTLSGSEVLASLCGDNWLHLHGDAPAWQAKEITRAMLEAFYPDDQTWRDAVWERAVTVFDQACRGLSGQC